MKPHWTKAYKVENERLKQEIAQPKMQPLLKSFAHEVGNNLMIMLANKPFVDWPDLAKIAYRHAANGRGTVAHFYKSNLPNPIRTVKGENGRPQFGSGVRVWFKPNRKIGIGTMTGDSHLAGTEQVRRWSVVFPHSRTKSRTVTLACIADDLELV